MSGIAVFGAGGRVGRAIVAEARERGHRVTAVVRDPAAHPDLAAPDVALAAGDVTDAEGVAALTAGHDAVISSVYSAAAPAAGFFPAAARALTGGIARTGGGRLVVVGVVSTVETGDGVRVMDGPGFPADGLEFSRGRARELEVYRAAPDTVDWLVVNPPLLLDYAAPRGGSYRARAGRAVDGVTGSISPADLALAVVDEAVTPKHHRTQLSVAG